ncbi:NAD(P)-binding domain-containing protein [Psychromarinibacter halotolerans]|uniref:NAD(P)-binding domain-containing protein n=1 Tax=Psychromarinibacter halotolerans TaxID=1775175 RepID=A0ABV7GUB6_9RHOB|nr:NAD(P)/FAD-dependent oxidoreductase [Psychromarinibacter halotolerans]MDF0596857.1 NAD(P)/FAD-dependent oxidoreductase [Psychromarinibacter halotolerans]
MTNDLFCGGLDGLEARLREDLDRLNFDGKDWVPQRTVAGQQVRDVVIIGAGMCGLVASVALRRHGIRNHVLYDMAPEGREGPWITIARMETLRSPKQLTGPAYGLPSLTFRAWFEATRGRKAWDALGRIDRADWMDYLTWYRRVMDVPVVNDARMTGLAEGPDGLIEVTLSVAGRTESVLTRKLVLATGRDGLGGNYVPPAVRDIDPKFWAHSADEIDFEALRGKPVVVVGAGASAMDNAATALEAGAERVDILIRRDRMPTINKGMGVGSPGMTHGFRGLPDDWKWKFQDYIGRCQTPPPRNSTLRVSQHENARFWFGARLDSFREDGDRLVISTPRGEFRTAYAIFATGFAVDFEQRPELALIAPHVRLWRDGKVDGARAQDGLAFSPVLGDHFELTEKEPGACPMLSSIYGFNFPATLSHGKLTGDIPAVSEGADRMVRGITESLFVEDVAEHYARLEAYDEPELLGDEWEDAEQARASA